MFDNIDLKGKTKEEKYQLLIPQIEALIEGEDDSISNMANISAILKQAFDFLWVGFYIVKNDILVLGPFQGSVACTRIQKGKGVCGTAWDRKETIIVEDVNNFSGHIACSSLSKSEIVVPLFDKNDNVIAVLDVDSEKLGLFDKVDAVFLEKISKLFIY
ncbi:MAG: GAF domain-containing protein [Bacteroidota bacterium]|jgi:GAF domain-containing protein